MFLPLRDANPAKTKPKMVITLIGATVAVFVGQFFMENLIVGLFACYPNKIMEFLSFRITRVIYLPGLFTYMFLHGGLLHILGNLWFLWIFGDNVEDWLGPRRFFRFYLLCGIIAALSHVFMNPSSPSPMVGASGAIAGVMGAYYVLYPKARITTLVLFWLIELPAVIFLGLWFAFQILFSLAESGSGGGVAWYAHIGGFIAGVVYIKVFARKRLRR